MKLVYARPNTSPDAAQLGPIQNVDKDYELSRGVPRAEGFPSDAYFEMDSDYGSTLDDVLRSTGGVLVISDRLRKFLEEEGLPNLEMLPVSLHNVEGTPVKDEYFVCHQTPLQDVLDLEQMAVKYNPINPKIIFSVDRIVIREDGLDPATKLLRLDRYPRPILFERGLAERIEGAGFTGIGFDALEAFDKHNLL